MIMTVAAAMALQAAVTGTTIMIVAWTAMQQLPT